MSSAQAPNLQGVEITGRPVSRWRQVAGTPTGFGAIGAAVVLLGLTLFGPTIWGHAAAHYYLHVLNRGPSQAHPFGTDELGRDVLARVLVATRLSIGLTMASATLAGLAGTAIGSAAVILGPRTRRSVEAIINLLVAFPPLVLALFFASIFGVGARGAVFALAVAVAPSVARLTQTLAASVIERDFIAAAKLLGLGRIRLLVRHVLPNIAAPLVVNFTLVASGLLLAFSSLSFLALGVQPPSYDWGQLMSDGLSDIYINPLAALGPGLAIVLAGLALNLCGEAAARALGERGRVVGRRARPPVMAPTPAKSLALAPKAEAAQDETLVVEDLWVSVPTPSGHISPVRGVSFTVRAGEALGIVGESGSGKSLTALAVAGLLRDPIEVRAARLDVLGRSQSGADSPAQRRLLGTNLAMIFQDPLSSLNPTMRVGRQLAEVAREHQGASRRSAFAKSIDRLNAVRIPAATRRAGQYPYEFSGGMRQRAMIAMGLMAAPRLLIADEPTTALDVTVQRQVLELISRMQADAHSALILISHDLAVVTQTCDRVLVMYAGQIVEDGEVTELIERPAHPYTRALLDTIPDMSTPRDKPLGTITGRPPQPAELPRGCAFAPRCPLADEQCHVKAPTLEHSSRAGHRVSCWHPLGPDAAAAFPPSHQLTVETTVHEVPR